MKSKEFIKRVKKYAKTNGLDFELNSRQGKGSHSVLKVGSKRTTVKHGEFHKSLLHAMLKQLNIDKKEF